MGHKLNWNVQKRKEGIGSPLLLGPGSSTRLVLRADAKTLLSFFRGSHPLGGRRVWPTARMHWILGCQPHLSGESGKVRGDSLGENKITLPNCRLMERKNEPSVPAQPHPEPPRMRPQVPRAGASGSAPSSETCIAGPAAPPCPGCPWTPVWPFSLSKRLLLEPHHW